MKNKRIFMKAAALALALSAAAAFPALAKEERTPVGRIALNISADVQVGESTGYVDVSVDEGDCSVDSADFVNEGEYWLGGDKPKLEIWLSAGSDCYFNKSGKTALTFHGDKVKYVSSVTKNDKETMVVTVTLEELKAEDEDLSVEGLSWDESNGIAHWNHVSIAKSYRVRLCRDQSSSEDGIGNIYSVTENSFNFSNKFPRAGRYYFKVKAVDQRGNAGDWESSYYMEVTEDDLAGWKGSWISDARGFWYSFSDNSYPVNRWEYIDSNWYFFDQEGYMKTGWIEWGDHYYYCGESGAMLTSTVTPDGYTVGEDGARQ